MVPVTGAKKSPFGKWRYFERRSGFDVIQFDDFTGFPDFSWDILSHWIFHRLNGILHGILHGICSWDFMGWGLAN